MSKRKQRRNHAGSDEGAMQCSRYDGRGSAGWRDAVHAGPRPRPPPGHRRRRRKRGRGCPGAGAGEGVGMPPSPPPPLADLKCFTKAHSAAERTRAPARECMRCTRGKADEHAHKQGRTLRHGQRCRHETQTLVRVYVYARVCVRMLVRVRVYVRTCMCIRNKRRRPPICPGRRLLCIPKRIRPAPPSERLYER